MLSKRSRMDGESSRPGAINVQDAKFTRCGWRKKRRISRRSYIDKSVIAGINTYMLRCWGVNPYASANGGYFRLANTNSTAANDVGHFLPMWYFDITAAMNWNNPNAGPAVLNFGQVSYRPFIRQGTSEVLTFRKTVTQFESPTGAVAGGNANTLYFTSQTGSSTQNGFLKAALHEYTSAKMLCYGIQGVPVRFRVSLVRFHKAHLCPGWEDQFFDNGTGTSVPGVAGFNTNVQEAVSLQQYLAGPFRHSPLNVQQTNNRKKYSEILIKDFVIGGAPTGQTPYMHQLEIFKQHNAIRKYDWQTNTGSNQDFAWDVNDYQQMVLTSQTNVDFTKRWYILVRAQALASTQTTDIDPVPDTTRTPSFDFNMINKYKDII